MPTKNPAAKALDKKKLMKEIDRDQRRARTAKLRDLQDAIRAARSKRQASMQAAGARCRAWRDRAKLAREIAKDARVKARVARLDAKGACAIPEGAAELARALRLAREHFAAEQQHQRELRALERSGRSRAKERGGVKKAREIASESDDEVRANIPPELVGLFNRVRRQIKASPRRARTEALLEYAADHPGEIYAGIDDETDAMIAAHERELRAANPRKKKKQKNAETGREAFKRTHWGQEGARVRPRALHVPDPKAGDLVELGTLRRVEYETDKGEGMQIFFHDFGRAVVGGKERGPTSGKRCPTLAFNRDGLVIAGGGYRVLTDGITG